MWDAGSDCSYQAVNSIDVAVLNGITGLRAVQTYIEMRQSLPNHML